MSRRSVYIIVAVAMVAVIALAWFFAISPARRNVANTTTEIAAARSSLASAQAQLAQAQETSKQGERNQARLLELAKMVPNGDEIPSLLLQIQDLANESGITFMSITPGKAIPLTQYQILPLDLVFQGHFFDLNDFIYRAEQMVAGPGRLLAIKTLALTPANVATGSSGGIPSSPLLNVTMTIYAYEVSPVAQSSTTATTTPAATPSTTATTAAASQ